MLQFISQCWCIVINYSLEFILTFTLLYSSMSFDECINNVSFVKIRMSWSILLIMFFLLPWPFKNIKPILSLQALQKLGYGLDLARLLTLLVSLYHGAKCVWSTRMCSLVGEVFSFLPASVPGDGIRVYFVFWAWSLALAPLEAGWLFCPSPSFPGGGLLCYSGTWRPLAQLS